MTFVLSRWEQTNAGIPVVIKPVFGKSEKIVGVGNMTNILGRDAGSKDSLQPIKILEFGIQLCFATPPLDGPLLPSSFLTSSPHLLEF